ncbi:hypothetical protein SAMN05421741_11337 [Paenimyroides ummariense]|uniref:Uncharacterized protein n=1 Tax=Paenimyroides ummariense TaxID=913024 RepID=A0A1I5CSA5_9FLAO|nr:hypothetical protein [Paenimyroides ummariense]SFN89726.1 hypothetical protein SAMN05421741_11337 [Paenimyroides ummariense]
MKQTIILLFLFLSCYVNAQGMLTKFGIYAANKSFAISYYEKQGREVATIPMIHVNKPAFYEMTKRKIDSLRNDGFVVFYEGINSDVTDSLQLDTLMRKFRHVTGFALMDYMDSENEAFKSLQNKKYVSQSDVDYGVNLDTDHHADLYLEQMIEMFEKRYGKIVLNNCDYKTSLGKKYKCTKIDENKEYYILNGIRDQHVLNKIEQSDAQKILVVFGRNHIKDIYSKIQSKGWRFQKEKFKRVLDF